MIFTHPLSESVLHNTEEYNPGKTTSIKTVLITEEPQSEPQHAPTHLRHTFWISTWLQMGAAVTSRWSRTASAARDRRSSCVTAPRDPPTLWNQAPPIITWKTNQRYRSPPRCLSGDSATVTYFFACPKQNQGAKEGKPYTLDKTHKAASSSGSNVRGTRTCWLYQWQVLTVGGAVTAAVYRQSGGLPSRSVVLRKGYRIIDHSQHSLVLWGREQVTKPLKQKDDFSVSILKDFEA